MDGSPSSHLRSAQALLSAWRSQGEDDLIRIGPTPHAKHMYDPSCSVSEGPPLPPFRWQGLQTLPAHKFLCRHENRAWARIF